MIDPEVPRETPSGPMPRRYVRFGIVGLVVVLVLLVGILLSNAIRVRPSGARPGVRTGPAESIVEVPPRRLEPTSVDVSRPVLRDTDDPRTSVGRAGDPAGSSAQKPVDPFETERKKRDFDSLYAGARVVTYRAGGDLPEGHAESQRRAGGAPVMPSTRDIVDEVIRASGGTPASSTSPAPSYSPPSVTTPGGDRGQRPPIETPPIDDSGPRHRVLESSIIDAVVINRLDGANDSPVIGKVTIPLYSHNLAYVLIPAETKIIGETRAVSRQGETRLAVVFHRMIFPDGRTRSLDQFKALHVSGSLGLSDQVNNHYLSTFGAAAAMSLVTGVAQGLGTRGLGGGGTNNTTVIAGSMGTGMSQESNQIFNRFLNRLPTITIREGYPFKVYITDDIELPAYSAPYERTPYGPQTQTR